MSPSKKGEYPVTVHVMDGGESHREMTEKGLRITLVSGEINVNGTTLRERNEEMIVGRRQLLAISVHVTSAYTVQMVDHRENTDPG